MKELYNNVTSKIIDHIYTYSGETLMWIVFGLGILVLTALFFLIRAGIRQFRHHLNDAMKAIMVRTYVSFAGTMVLTAFALSLPWNKIPDNVPWEAWCPPSMVAFGTLLVLWLRHVWGYKVLDWRRNDVLEEKVS